MECIACKAVIQGANRMKEHYVTLHNVPSNDAILNRYIKLNFSRTAYSSWTKAKRETQKASVLLKLEKRINDYEIARGKESF